VAAGAGEARPSQPPETDRADGVFEGGGVEGLAFAGALAAEETGVRSWVNVAGTSAGCGTRFARGGSLGASTSVAG
jgi:hypothetical protein